MEEESQIRNLNSHTSFNKFVGTGFALGYAIGTIVGIVSFRKELGLLNNITRYNCYFGALGIKAGIGLYCLNKLRKF